MRRPLGIVGAALAGFLCFALLTVLTLGVKWVWDELPKADRPFTSTEWAATNPEERYVFTDDLINPRLLIGRSEAEIASLLGSAESRRPDQETGRTELLWQVGWYGIDPMVLSVELDRAGRVLQVRVRES